LIRIGRTGSRNRRGGAVTKKSGSDSFGAKVARRFRGQLRVLLTHLFDPNLKSISQRDTIPAVAATVSSTATATAIVVGVVDVAAVVAVHRRR
jgi:hypothetical protein